MRAFVAKRSVALNAAAQADGYIALFDLDMLALQVSPVNPTEPAASGFTVGGLGRLDRVEIELAARITPTGVVAQENFPPYVLIRMVPGNYDNLSPFAWATGAFYEQQEAVLMGSWSGAGAAVAAAVPVSFRFQPVGRMNRFGFQVEPGVQALASFTLDAEFWMVDHGR